MTTPSLVPGVAGSRPSSHGPSEAGTAEFLTALLDKVASVDKEGFFQVPVDEKLHHAPNYYSIIKQPICFRDMKQRLSTGCYASYRQIREDFELICSNAKTFNKSTTKVYKAAGLLLSKGSKILNLHELDIRKAFSLISAAAAPSPSYSGAILGLPAPSVVEESLQEPSASMDALGEANSEGGYALRSHRGSPARPFDHHLGSDRPADRGAAHRLLPDAMPRPTVGALFHLGSGYISEAEEEAEAGQQPLEEVLHRMRCSAQFQRWEEQAGAADRPAQPMAEPSGRTAEWRDQRRPVEWQCRWLELRMFELKSQRRRLEHRLAALKTQEQPTGASSTPAHLASDKEVLCTSMERMGRVNGSVHAAAFFQMRIPDKAQADARPLVPRHPSITALADAAVDQKLHGSSPSLPLASQPVDDRQAPALIYATCDLLAQQLQQLRNQLLEVYPNLDKARAALTYGFGALPGGKHPGRRGSHGHGMAGAEMGGLSILTRMDSKRKRGDMPELDGLGSPSLRSAIAGERMPVGNGTGQQQGFAHSEAPVLACCNLLPDSLQTRQTAHQLADSPAPHAQSAIFIPPVREIPEEEQQARLVAATTWNDDYRAMGEWRKPACPVPWFG